MTDVPHRTVFFVSDGTGITAQMLGQSLLTQFEGVEFKQVTLPFIDSAEKAEECLARIAAESGNGKPLVFSTLVNQEVREVLRRADALIIDFFESFIGPLENGLGVKSSHTIGRSHSAMDKKEYQQRIEAINFSMAHDDGASHRELALADVILIGVSRSGKTPTSLYLALQFGVKAANYPLIPEDFERGKLPTTLYDRKGRLYGLTIAPERLHEIRSERRPNSKYAELENCRYEVKEAEDLMRREGIRCHRRDRDHHPARTQDSTARLLVIEWGKEVHRGAVASSNPRIETRDVGPGTVRRKTKFLLRWLSAALGSRTRRASRLG
jgi:regulator of PEP synthase PpsR (kinase-PPPase family)